MSNAFAMGGGLPNTGVDAGPLAGQGPQVDAGAMKTPPAAPTTGEAPTPGSGPGASPVSLEQAKDIIHKQAVIDNRMRQLLSTKGPIQRKQIIEGAVQLVSDRIMSAQSMAGFLADLPEDPQDIREWVERHAKEAEAHLVQVLGVVHGAEAQQGAVPDMPPGGGGLPGGIPQGVQ